MSDPVRLALMLLSAALFTGPMSCAHTPPAALVESTPTPEIYGQPGLWTRHKLGEEPGYAWVPGGFAVASEGTIEVRSLPGGARKASFPTPCPRSADATRYLPRALIDSDDGFPLLVVSCESRQVFFMDPRTGVARDVGTADVARAGAQVLLLSGTRATWVDTDGHEVDGIDLPSELQPIANAGSVWVWTGRRDSQSFVWWIDLATRATQERTIDSSVSAAATDGVRIAVYSSHGLLWIDTATGELLGEEEGYFGAITFVGSTLWAASDGGFRRFSGPGAELDRVGVPLPRYGSRLSGGQQGALAWAYDVVTAWLPDGTSETPIPSPWWGVSDFGLTADGNQIAVVDEAHSLFVVDRQAGTTRYWNLRDQVSKALAQPSDSGRWVAVGPRGAFLSTQTGAISRDEEFGMAVVEGHWTPDECFEGIYWDGRHSAAAGWCPDTAPGAVSIHSVVLPGQMRRSPFSVNPEGTELAATYRQGYAIMAIGPHAPPTQYQAGDWGDEDRFIPKILPSPDQRSGSRVLDLAYQVDGTLVTLSGVNSSYTVQRGDVSSTLELPGSVRLTSDGSLVLRWDENAAALYNFGGGVVASTHLAGQVTRVRTARCTAAFLLEDGRIQVLEAPKPCETAGPEPQPDVHGR